MVEPLFSGTFEPAKAVVGEELSSYKNILSEWLRDSFEIDPASLETELSLTQALRFPVYEFTLVTLFENRGNDLKPTVRPFEENMAQASPVMPRQQVQVWDYPSEPRTTFDLHKGTYLVPTTLQIKECVTCYANGRVTCNRCYGSGSIPCDQCTGLGKRNCSSCAGTGKTACLRCSGKGLQPGGGNCDYCEGAGKVDCGFCTDGQVECTLCQGGGEQPCKACEQVGTMLCQICFGKGKLANGLAFQSEFRPFEVSKLTATEPVPQEVLMAARSNLAPFGPPVILEKPLTPEKVKASGLPPPLETTLTEMLGNVQSVLSHRSRVTRQKVSLKSAEAVRLEGMVKGRDFIYWLHPVSHSIFAQKNPLEVRKPADGVDALKAESAQLGAKARDVFGKAKGLVGKMKLGGLLAKFMERRKAKSEVMETAEFGALLRRGATPGGPGVTTDVAGAGTAGGGPDAAEDLAGTAEDAEAPAGSAPAIELSAAEESAPPEKPTEPPPPPLPDPAPAPSIATPGTPKGAPARPFAAGQSRQWISNFLLNDKMSALAGSLAAAAPLGLAAVLYIKAALVGIHKSGPAFRVVLTLAVLALALGFIWGPVFRRSRGVLSRLLGSFLGTFAVLALFMGVARWGFHWNGVKAADQAAFDAEFKSGLPAGFNTIYWEPELDFLQDLVKKYKGTQVNLKPAKEGIEKQKKLKVRWQRDAMAFKSQMAAILAARPPRNRKDLGAFLEGKRKRLMALRDEFIVQSVDVKAADAPLADLERRIEEENAKSHSHMSIRFSDSPSRRAGAKPSRKPAKKSVKTPAKKTSKKPAKKPSKKTLRNPSREF